MSQQLLAEVSVALRNLQRANEMGAKQAAELARVIRQLAKDPSP